MRLLTIIAVIILMAACSSVPTDSRGWIEPMEAIRAANEDPAHGVRGDFIITVKAQAALENHAYLNSELDYRDQRNLTIRMPLAMVPKLEEHLGVEFGHLKNRRLVVSGVARRVRIDFIDDGGPTGKYYYQTHVRVNHPSQIRFAD